jgi:hypothetical protein
MLKSVALHDVSPYIHRGAKSVRGPKAYSKIYVEGFPAGGLAYLFSRISYNLLNNRYEIILCMDSPTDRKLILPEYKANRDGFDLTVSAQIKLVQDLCGYVGIPVYKEENMEADDLVANAASQLKESRPKIIIHSNDMDLTHSVDYNVEFFPLDESANLVDLQNFSQAISPEETVLPVTVSAYKVFTGCSSDGIKTFTSETGHLGKSLYRKFCQIIGGIPNISIETLRSKEALVKFLDFLLAKSVITAADREMLGKRADVIFPRKSVTQNFVPKGVGDVNVKRLAELLSMFKQSPMAFSISRTDNITPSEEMVNLFREKFRELSSGAFAVDNSFSFDSGSSIDTTMNVRDYY